MILIGMSGKRGVGKTVCAKHLERFYGFQRKSFADSLRSHAKMLLPFTDDDLSDPKKKEAKFGKYDFTPREFMIHLGEFMRFHDKDYWVNVVLNSLKKTGKYVIDDVRYENEASLIKNLGGKLIRVERYEQYNPYGKNLDIDSETSLDNYKDFDYEIPSPRNLSLKELTEQVDQFMGPENA